ncbi:hypothetical protein [Mucilaginibacter sp. AK015]|uniref:hypothetical protein n=1 Tax=Mucilaginibacter sp. AK015 TaxID=2723072 RepID=UPI001616C989|nr:hypothetical protein [Mucilaginibacter sp. AK015]MBB5396030.1 hypothetical protein [Mucilaginibacter sp. AK015]
MKPTEQQLKVLQDYLYNTLAYRETYEEIYDHILSAMEHQPGNISFEDAINNIIRSDFGSPANLLKLEQAGKKALVKDALRRFGSYFTDCFKFPGVLYALVSALLAYYIFSHVQFSANAIWGMFALVVFTPGMICLLRLYNTGYILDTTRRSAKDKLFENLAGLPIRICLIPIIITNLAQYKIWESNNYYLLTISFVLGIFYNIALYKLYKREFKTAAAK